MEEGSFQPPLGQVKYSDSSSNKSKKFLFLFVFLILLVGVGFLTTKYFLGGEKEARSLTIEPTPTEYQFPTDGPTAHPTPQATPTASLKPKATTKPTANPVDSSGLDRSALNVEVQNGNGETGVASKGSDVLKSLGYNVTATGNADNFDYQNVTIQVKSTKSKYLDLLKKDLGFSYTIGTTSADLSSSSTADALVIIGK
ncbi:MAG: LytR C-terminal domain-containing protein [Patescibacteria group bacterium]